MTPQTTFVGNVNPWKAYPEHRPRPWAAEPIVLEAEPDVVEAKPAPRNSWRGAVLEQIQQMGSASCRELVDAMDLSKNSITCALTGLCKEGRLRIKTVPIKNRKPSYRYFPA